jgi:hypothetical protein
VVTPRRTGASRFGCLLTLLIISAVMYFGINAAEVYWRYLQYKDAMAQEVRFRSFLPNSRIRQNLANIADSLGLPEDAGVVTVTRERGRVTVEAHYEDWIELPGYRKEVHFEPRASSGY